MSKRELKELLMAQFDSKPAKKANKRAKVAQDDDDSSDTDESVQVLDTPVPSDDEMIDFGSKSLGNAQDDPESQI